MGIEIEVSNLEEMCDLMCNNNLPRRGRASMFSPFRKEIKEWCGAGLTINEMLDRLGEGYTPQGLYAYIRINRLRDEPWKDVYNARNKCDECEYCHEYVNLENNTGRICCKSWKLIQKGVRYSPKWCEK